MGRGVKVTRLIIEELSKIVKIYT